MTVREMKEGGGNGDEELIEVLATLSARCNRSSSCNKLVE